MSGGLHEIYKKTIQAWRQFYRSNTAQIHRIDRWR